ncbi:acetyl-CoA carboxylase carboxyltransferase subunit alpha [Nonomuraea basaltis]|uniref:acetyl-CoA carboxylase carboxyltransferase subunit alpha n=1 Tax=Nonomuraea basaltis TaxID=2495887 RepID=UPI00110C4BA4|nr:acetyl-CoA carboxylase carboxyltransferase subunit alpha [Nonomuraea basaltis]TMR95149.1 acetyl-CoA carboxylase carboxyltransferase subunit alpha [Nonomuraea basaltis]
MTLTLDGATTSWTACAGCGSLLYVPKLTRGKHVCPDCGHHHRLGARERLRLLLDEDSFQAAPAVEGGDPLGFADSRPYPERLAAARRATGLTDAVLHGKGTLGGRPLIALAMDFAFMGGSMGSAVGETVARAADEALATRSPLLLVAASGGARMQEGSLSLMQMAKTAQAVRRLRRAGVPSVCLLTDPTFGGVTASFATLADILVAERGSLIGFAGPRVIAAATRERLPEGFQTAEYLFSRGMLDRVESRESVRPLLARLLNLLDGATPPYRDQQGAPAHDGGETAASAWETVRLARDIQRPSTLDYISHMCEDFVELHGDRVHGDDPAIVGGLCSLGGVNAMIIGHQKGHDTQELISRNFGMAHPEGYRKALRLMRLAESYGLPVITLIDTQGAAPGIGAEERGQAWAIASAIAGMGELTVPIVATVTGEGGSGGALALGVADEVLMMRNACYSVISPESCSTILCGEPSRAEQMAESLRLTAPELLRLGVIDGIVPEPEGGSQADHLQAAANLKSMILDSLGRLSRYDPHELVRRRHDRFRALGSVSDV